MCLRKVSFYAHHGRSGVFRRLDRTGHDTITSNLRTGCLEDLFEVLIQCGGLLYLDATLRGGADLVGFSTVF